MSQLSSQLLKDNFEAADQSVPLALQLIVLQPLSFECSFLGLILFFTQPPAPVQDSMLHAVTHHTPVPLALRVLCSAPAHLSLAHMDATVRTYLSVLACLLVLRPVSVLR